MKIAVTGACGSLGRNLCESLERMGHHIIRIDRVDCAEHANFRLLNVTEFEPLAKAFSGTDAVVHLAGIPVPGKNSPVDLYFTNAYGSYLVYHAASLAGVRNVVAASSINALGYYFGVVSRVPRYLPLTEDHPRFPTDPYSFSKKAVEDIAEYFWERDGIGGAAIRIPITFDAQKREYNLARYHRIRLLVEKVMTTTSGDWLTRFRACVDRYRFDRAREHGRDPARYFTDDEASLVAWVYGFFMTLEIQDLANAVEGLCGLASFGGCPFIGSSYNYLGMEAQELAEFFFPDVPRAGLSTGPVALVSTTLLRSLIDWKPRNTDAELERTWKTPRD